MTVSDAAPYIVVGVLHGFIVWRLLFRMVGPVARVSQGHRKGRLRTTLYVAYMMSFFLLMTCAILLLKSLGTLVSQTVNKEGVKYLFIGSMAGFALSVVLPRGEMSLRAYVRTRKSRKSPSESSSEQ